MKIAKVVFTIFGVMLGIAVLVSLSSIGMVIGAGLGAVAFPVMLLDGMSRKSRKTPGEDFMDRL